MEIGAEGGKRFKRIMRLAGLPEGARDVSVVQKGTPSKAKSKVLVGWES